MEQKELLNKIVDVVRECGEIILHADRNKSGIDEKARHANFVTAYDKKIQQILQKRLLQILPEAVLWVRRKISMLPSQRAMHLL